jgi:hypothetical protein
VARASMTAFARHQSRNLPLSIERAPPGGVPTERSDDAKALAVLALEMCEAAAAGRDPRPDCATPRDADIDAELAEYNAERRERGLAG